MPPPTSLPKLIGSVKFRGWALSEVRLGLIHLGSGSLKMVWLGSNQHSCTVSLSCNHTVELLSLSGAGQLPGSCQPVQLSCRSFSAGAVMQLGHRVGEEIITAGQSSSSPWISLSRSCRCCCWDLSCTFTQLEVWAVSRPAFPVQCG